MAKKLALGKGIASLLQETKPQATVVTNTYEEQFGKPKAPVIDIDAPPPTPNRITIENSPMLVSIEKIKTNPNQPRKIFKDKELEELANSIKENGIIQPLIVAEGDNGEYELVAGERRLRAAKKAGLEQVPVVVKRGTDRDKMIMSIIENIQRSDLNCVEEALAYFQLMNEYKLTQDEVAKKLGKERSSVANYLRVLNLPRTTIELLQKELLSFGHAKVLAAVKEREEVVRLANDAVNKNWSVRELEAAIKNNQKVPKEKEDVSLTFFQEKIGTLKKTLEQKTGYHFAIAANPKGAGEIAIKFSNEAEFNDIYEFILSKRI